MRRARPLLALGVALACAAAFLAPERTCAVRGGPPAPRAFRSVCRGKPGVALGDARLSVVDRPYLDTAVVRADWTRAPEAERLRLELVLPQGASLEEGELEQDLPEGLLAGATTWRVRFPLDRTSDLTVRLCAHVDGCEGARERYARLWEAE